MSIAFLNGSYMPIEEVKISPLDRGFLFGDGIYEVIPSYHGRTVGFGPHISRMNDGLNAVEIKLNWSDEQWRELCTTLCEKNGNGNLGIYLHVTRGADTKRHHAYPVGIEPTMFAYTFEIPEPPVADRNTVKPYTCSTAHDLRWHRCNIKSISLLGNVMHYQQGHVQGDGEILLFNQDNELTECGACNERDREEKSTNRKLLEGRPPGYRQPSRAMNYRDARGITREQFAAAAWTQAITNVGWGFDVEDSIVPGEAAHQLVPVTPEPGPGLRTEVDNCLALEHFTHGRGTPIAARVPDRRVFRCPASGHRQTPPRKW